MYTMCVLKNQRVRRALSSFSVFVFVFSMLFGCFGGMQESIGDDFGPEKTILGKMKKENGVPSWYQPGDISVQPAMDTTKDTTNIIMKDLAHTRNFNEPFPDWVTHYKPINSRYLQLSSHNFADKSYLPKEYAGSQVLWDIKTNEIILLEQKIAEDAGLFLPFHATPKEHFTDGKFTNSTDWYLFTFIDYSKIQNVKEPNQVPSCLFGIHNLQTGETRFLDKFVSFSHFYVTSSKECQYLVFSDYYHKMFLVDTIAMTSTELSNCDGKEYYAKDCEFSPSQRYVIHTVYNYGETNESGIEWIIYDTKTGKRIKGNGIIHGFTEKENAVITKTNEKIAIVLLENGQDVTESFSLKPYENYSYHFLEDKIELVSIDGKQAILLFDNVYSYQLWDDYLYVYQKGTSKILCYSRKNHACFEIDFTSFYSEGGRYEQNNGFEFFIANDGKDLILQSEKNQNYPESPDLINRFIDETDDLSPVVEIVGEALWKYEEEVLNKLSYEQRYALPGLYKYIMGLQITKEDLIAANQNHHSYSLKTIELIYCGDKEKMLKGLMNPYAFYSNEQVRTYAEVLNMTKKEIKNGGVSLEAYQEYFDQIHYLIVNHYSFGETLEFEKKCQEFYQKYEEAFPRA